MNPPVTLTYSKLSNGWTSRWSFIPDWMLGMNNTFYTWKNGNLYKHDSNILRNSFYGDIYESTITTVLNESPTEVKMFKTLVLDSNRPWEVNLITDLEVGIIDDNFFKEKEGEWYSYIRRPNDNTVDTRSLSLQGVGPLFSLTGTTFVISGAGGPGVVEKVSALDRVYSVDPNNNNTLTYLGTVSTVNVSGNSFDVSSLVGPAPTQFTLIVVAKNNMVESYGLRGYYMQVHLTLPIQYSPQDVELFSIESSVFKSYP
jgi:hypothetical protein